MTVVIAIVAIISGVISFSYSKFTTNVSVRNLAQDVALAIRKTQSYATSVQSLPNGTMSNTKQAYGIVFSLEAPTSNVAIPSTKNFVLFADVNGDGQYNAGTSCGNPTAGNECLEGFSITTADSISKICSDVIGAGCSNSGTSVIMEFCRPAPDAAIYLNNSVSLQCASGASYAEVWVQSAKGLTQSIRLWNTGQITVQ